MSKQLLVWMMAGLALSIAHGAPIFEDSFDTTDGWLPDANGSYLAIGDTPGTCKQMPGSGGGGAVLQAESPRVDTNGYVILTVSGGGGNGIRGSVAMLEFDSSTNYLAEHSSFVGPFEDARNYTSFCNSVSFNANCAVLKFKIWQEWDRTNEYDYFGYFPIPEPSMLPLLTALCGAGLFVWRSVQ